MAESSLEAMLADMKRASAAAPMRRAVGKLESDGIDEPALAPDRIQHEPAQYLESMSAIENAVGSEPTKLDAGAMDDPFAELAAMMGSPSKLDEGLAEKEGTPSHSKVHDCARTAQSQQQQPPSNIFTLPSSSVNITGFILTWGRLIRWEGVLLAAEFCRIVRILGHSPQVLFVRPSCGIATILGGRKGG